MTFALSAPTFAWILPPAACKHKADDSLCSLLARHGLRCLFLIFAFFRAFGCSDSFGCFRLFRFYYSDVSDYFKFLSCSDVFFSVVEVFRFSLFRFCLVCFQNCFQICFRCFQISRCFRYCQMFSFLVLDVKICLQFSDKIRCLHVFQVLSEFAACFRNSS